MSLYNVYVYICNSKEIWSEISAFRKFPRGLDARFIQCATNHWCFEQRTTFFFSKFPTICRRQDGESNLLKYATVDYLFKLTESLVRHGICIKIR